MTGPNEIPVAHELRSAEHAQLLDAIDRLRREDIRKDISIPEIVVCGDQSSGKSSVLEAIAGVSFPSGANTVTRFPTEVVLRNDSGTESRIEIRIIPAPEGWSKDQRAQVASWQPDSTAINATDVPEVVRKAHLFLQSLDQERKFWHDRLQIQIKGPSQPHLTLVDLPGLIHNDPTEKNLKKIRELTRTYIRSQRAVVLAIVDAPNDLERHQIIRLLRECGSKDRTMGILTKADTLDVGSDEEASRVSMVKAGTKELGLGWHVLCNPRDDRDEKEKALFAREAWTNLPSECKGASSLRKKLSYQLLARIQRDLPRLIEEMQTELGRRRDTLQQLGKARETDTEKRRYLTGLSEKLVPLIRSALDGDYDKEESEQFFGDLNETDQNGRRLREEMNLRIDDFASEMRRLGRSYRVTYDRKIDG